MEKDLTLVGITGWYDVDSNHRTPAFAYSDAVYLLSRFAARVDEVRRSSSAQENMAIALRAMTFGEVTDTLAAAKLVRCTSHHYRTNADDGLLTLIGYQDVSRPRVINISREVIIDDACRRFEYDLLDEQLERVWRSPNDFPRNDDFHRQLFNRATQISLPTSQGKELSILEASAQFAQIGIDFYQSKVIVDEAIKVWNMFAKQPTHGIFSKDERAIRKALKLGEWPIQLQQAFDWFGNVLRVDCRHLALWALRTGTPGFELPILDGSAPTK
jgi:hypothetical protein